MGSVPNFLPIFYDAVMRLPLTAFAAYFLVREWQGLDSAQGTLYIAAHVATMLFLALIAVMTIARRRAVRKADGWAPRFAAPAGDRGPLRARPPSALPRRGDCHHRGTPAISDTGGVRAGGYTVLPAALAHARGGKGSGRCISGVRRISTAHRKADTGALL